MEICQLFGISTNIIPKFSIQPLLFKLVRLKIHNILEFPLYQVKFIVGKRKHKIGQEKLYNKQKLLNWWSHRM